MNNKKMAIFYIAITTILFSTVEIALKTVSNQFNPIQMNFTRFFIGGLILLPISLYFLNKKGIKLNVKSILYFAFLGFVVVVMSMTFFQLAIIYSNASLVAVLFSGNPIFIMFFAYIFLKEPFSTKNIIALILEVIGILVIINPLNAKLDPLGVTFCLISTILFSLYGVLGKKQCDKYGGLTVTSFSFVFGSLELMLLCTLTHINGISSFLDNKNLGYLSNIPFIKGWTIENTLMMLYISIVLTGIGFAFYFIGMEKTSTLGGSIVFFIKPALASILAFILIQEKVPFNMIAGISIILIGSIFTIVDMIKSNKNKIKIQK